MSELFERTSLERTNRVRAVLQEERLHRIRMRDRNPKQVDYWQGRVEQVESAICDLDVIEACAREGRCAMSAIGRCGVNLVMETLMLVAGEIRAAQKKHGDRFVTNLPLTTRNGDIVLHQAWAAGREARDRIEGRNPNPGQTDVLLEEVGELAEALLFDLSVEPEKWEAEAIQVAAMCVTMVAESRRKRGEGS